MATIAVDTPSKSYAVEVGAGIRKSLGDVVKAHAKGEVAALIADDSVAALYGDEALSSLREAGFKSGLITFPHGEASKNLATLDGMLESMAELGMTRDDLVVALGGGVTGDMGGLAAALYMRGTRVVQVPTSLLAMVDSSVGGKTAVDLKRGKNLVGAFFQPEAVLADVECLRTLSEDLFRDSLGEVVKHGVLASPHLLDVLTETGLSKDSPADLLVDVVAENVRIKRDVVNADETERGLRATLNLGHTIGHSLEAASDYTLGHGSCVATGLAILVRGCAAEGLTPGPVAERIVSVIESLGLPTKTDVSAEAIVQGAVSDKKRHGSGVNLIVVRDIADVEIVPMALDDFAAIVKKGL